MQREAQPDGGINIIKVFLIKIKLKIFRFQAQSYHQLKCACFCTCDGWQYFQSEELKDFFFPHTQDIDVLFILIKLMRLSLKSSALFIYIFVCRREQGHRSIWTYKGGPYLSGIFEIIRREASSGLSFIGFTQTRILIDCEREFTFSRIQWGRGDLLSQPICCQYGPPDGLNWQYKG